MSGAFNSGLYPIVRPQQPVSPFWMGDDQNNVRWEMLQGDTFAQFIQLFCECQLVPDITGYFFIFTIKASMDPADPNILCQTVWQELHGQCSATALIVSPYVTATVPEGRYAFDLKYRTVTGSVQTVTRGEIDVLPTVDLSLSVVPQPAAAGPNPAWNWLWLALGSDNTPMPDSVVTSWLNQGGSIRGTWANSQPHQPSAPTDDPNDPSYNWSFWDTEIARWEAAGKLMMVRMQVQSSCPAWVFAMPGVQSFRDVQGQKMWFYTDPIVTPYVQAMLRAWGKRYGSNKNIVLVLSPICSAFADFYIPFKETRWKVSHSFKWPDYGQSVTAQVQYGTTGNYGLFIGHLVYCIQYGYLEITEVFGPLNHAGDGSVAPTAVTLKNIGFPGNVHSGIIGITKVMYISDTNNLLNVYGFNADAIVQAQVDANTILIEGFPNAVVSSQVVRTSYYGSAPGSQGHPNPSLAPTPDYICTNIQTKGEAIYGKRWAFQKDNLDSNLSLYPPATNTENYAFTLLGAPAVPSTVRYGSQFLWWSAGDPTYRNNQGKPGDPLTILINCFLQAEAWKMQWVEYYQVDDVFLRSVWTEPPNWGIWAKNWGPPNFGIPSLMSSTAPKLLPNRPNSPAQVPLFIGANHDSLKREKTLRDLINRQNAMGRLT